MQSLARRESFDLPRVVALAQVGDCVRVGRAVNGEDVGELVEVAVVSWRRQREQEGSVDLASVGEGVRHSSAWSGRSRAVASRRLGRKGCSRTKTPWCGCVTHLRLSG